MNVNASIKQTDDNAWAPPTTRPQVAANRSQEDIDLWSQLTGRVMEIAIESGWNKAEVARRTGMPSGSFSAWFSGNIGEGRLDNNNSKIQKFVEQIEEQAGAIASIPQSPAFFQTRTSKEIVKALDWAQGAGDLVIITIGAGMGKTATCTQYRNRRPNVFMATSSPSTKTVHGMLHDLAAEMGVSEHNPAKYVRAIGNRLAQSGNSLLIIDEAQHLVDDAINQLRHFVDCYKCGVALVGNNEIYDRLKARNNGPSYAQLKRRIGTRLDRAKPYAEDIKAAISAWNVTEDSSVKLLTGIALKGGALGQVDKTMKLATMLAIGAGEAPTYAFIKAAWENRNVEDFS
jgi:hypothetical protein